MRRGLESVVAQEVEKEHIQKSLSQSTLRMGWTETLHYMYCSDRTGAQVLIGGAQQPLCVCVCVCVCVGERGGGWGGGWVR